MKTMKLSLATALALGLAAPSPAQKSVGQPVNGVFRAVNAIGVEGARATGVSSLISLAEALAAPQADVPLHALVPVLEAVIPEHMEAMLALQDDPGKRDELAKALASHFHAAEASAESTVSEIEDAVRRGLEVAPEELDRVLNPIYEPFVSVKSKRFLSALREARRLEAERRGASAFKRARKALGIPEPKEEAGLAWDLSRAREHNGLYASLRKTSHGRLVESAELRSPDGFWENANAFLEGLSQGVGGQLEELESRPIGPWAENKLYALRRQTVTSERLIANLKASQGIAGGLLLGKGSRGGVEADRLVPEALRRSIEEAQERGQRRENALRGTALANWKRLNQPRLIYSERLELLELIRRGYASLLGLAASNPDPHHLPRVKADLLLSAGLPSIGELRAFWEKSVAIPTIAQDLNIEGWVISLLQLIPAALYGSIALLAAPLPAAFLVTALPLGIVFTAHMTFLYRLGRNRVEDFGKMGGRWQELLDFVSGEDNTAFGPVLSRGRTWGEAAFEALVVALLSLPMTLLVVVPLAYFLGLGEGALIASVLGINAVATLFLSRGVDVRFGR